MQNRDDSPPQLEVKGKLKLNNIEIDVYVLKGGMPLISRRKMTSLLGRTWSGKSETEYPAFIGAKNIQSFINDELKQKLIPIEFKDGNKLLSAFHADIIPLIADTYLKAREAGVLTNTQMPTAKKCEIIVRTLARIGITALIYEATGYEKYKNPDVLRKLVESYLAKEVREWTKNFPDEFFFALDSIYGNERTISRRRPQYYAKFINKYIYEPIENGLILDELKKMNPVEAKGYRKKRFHQFLNEEKGIKKLQAQLWQVTALLKIAANKRKFKESFERLISPIRGGYLFGEYSEL